MANERTADRAADAARLRRALAANPQDRVGWHNLAAAEGDLGHAAEAEAAARRALALGIPAPETRLVLARALQDLNRLDEAERMFEEALARRPTYPEAHRDLAQLRWMRTGRVDAALAALDAALRKAPQESYLHLVRSVALEYIGERPAALASAEAGLADAPSELQLLRQASHLCAELGEGARAVAFAQRATAAAPGVPAVQITLCEALLASGAIAQAESVAARLCAMDSLDQHAVALRATAWRLLGDARYEALYDYARLTHAETIDAPLGELAADLEALHRYRAHPFQQSVRGGGQLPLNAREMARPSLRTLFEMFHEVVQRHLARLGTGADPFRSRNTGRFAQAGAWSVRLTSGGYHTDHVHQRGWLSSAFYVAVPPVMKPEAAHAGWLRLGQPGITTEPKLAPDFRVKPAPGKLVLFPSYMWHGVEPFESDQPRLTVAFDALPA
jgi:predicted Zn-dependent protease